RRGAVVDREPPVEDAVVAALARAGERARLDAEEPGAGGDGGPLGVDLGPGVVAGVVEPHGVRRLDAGDARHAPALDRPQDRRRAVVPLPEGGVHGVAGRAVPPAAPRLAEDLAAEGR